MKNYIGSLVGWKKGKKILLGFVDLSYENPSLSEPIYRINWFSTNEEEYVTVQTLEAFIKIADDLKQKIK